MNSSVINVKKRNGRLQKLNINKINLCAERACQNLGNVSASEIVIDANVQLYDKIPTKEIDRALIMSARQKIEKEPNYAYVASRLLLASVHKEVFGESRDKDGFEHQYRLSFIRNIKKLVSEEILDENPDIEEGSIEFDEAFKEHWIGKEYWSYYGNPSLTAHERNI